MVPFLRAGQIIITTSGSGIVITPPTTAIIKKNCCNVGYRKSDVLCIIGIAEIMEDVSSTFPSFSSTQWVFNAVDSQWFKLNWLEAYQPSWLTVLVVVAVAVYSAWYYLLVVNKPRLVGGGSALKQHIVSHCPILSQYYYPTFWAPNCHVSTIARAKLQKCPGVTYERYEVIILKLFQLLPLI